MNVGNGSALRVIQGEHGEQVAFDGTVIVTRHDTFIDDGSVRYLVMGDLPHGQAMHVEGILNGVRITPAKCEPAGADPALALMRVEQFLSRLEK